MLQNDAETELSPAQQRAIEMIAAGCRRDDVAKSLGIHRTTLSRWFQIAEFRRELDVLNASIRDEAFDRLSSLGNLAIDAISSSLAEGDGRVGLTVAEKLGLFSAPERPEANAHVPEPATLEENDLLIETLLLSFVENPKLRAAVLEAEEPKHE